MLRNLLVVSCIFLWLASCKPELPADVAAAYDDLPDKLDYNIHVKPILSDKCFACHGPDKAKQKAGLRLDLADAAKSPLPENPSKVAIKPGDVERSEVFHRIVSVDPDYLMPSPDSHLELSAKDKAILIRWIEDGAEYKPHWAWVKPQQHDIPTSAFADQVINPIDNFIFNTLEREGLVPSKEADKEILLRRLTLDLTGLPPTLEEIDSFLKDASPNAYEKQVDRLFKSPHYGEKMAVQWLDIARFADSHGYTVDRLRDMSPYRDWVIKAFNENYPYDKFIQWQLAGDLMPKANREMILATAFNRNHQQNLEGGIIEEEFQTEYVVDRTNTFGEAFMGVSVGCARCHDHKYDPISQKNYYEIFSFFNNVREAGQISWDNALPTPTLMMPTDKQEKIMAFLEKEINSSERKEDSLKQTGSAEFAKWVSSASFSSLQKDKLPQSGLIAYYPFDDSSLKNKTNPRQSGEMRQLTGAEKPVFKKHDQGNALALNGDIWLDLKEVGIFRRMDPFSIGIWIYVPKELKEGVIFHKSNAERLYNFRGYHLYLKDSSLEMSITHTAPSNAITKRSFRDLPRDQWIQLTMTYDGSSKANGMHLFLNGNEMPMETTMDQLTKDILLYSGQPGLQIGAWDRGWGFKNGQVDDIAVYDRELSALEAKILARSIDWNEITSTSKPDTNKDVKQYYDLVADPELKNARQQLREKRRLQVDSAERISEVMVMQEMAKPKKSYLLQRGSYDAHGEEVFPNTPESILAFNKNLPKNRLGLAQWLTDENHPLTARVAVNRFLQNFFGTGLVKTSEDFGNQGGMPSHPELLDWLAINFQSNGWDIRKIQKMIAMSATYRQDSKASVEAVEKDPENRWLSHGPAQRLSAEMIRDNALMACGLMETKIGGKSVKPYQPDGLWEINNTHYDADTGRVVYRRSLYVVVKRTVPNPTLATFDAPSRSYCVVRRQQTNTPLQSLVTLNDPTFIEACSVLGEQMTRAGNGKQTIIDAYRKLTGRTPRNAEVELLTELQKKQYEKFVQYPDKAKGWLNAGQHKTNKMLDTSWTAANTVVASTILNSDATLMKR